MIIRGYNKKKDELEKYKSQCKAKMDKSFDILKKLFISLNNIKYSKHENTNKLPFYEILYPDEQEFENLVNSFINGNNKHRAAYEIEELNKINQCQRSGRKNCKKKSK